MLRQSFVHVPGIGRTTELALWKQGCLDWSEYLHGTRRYSTGRAPREEVCTFLQRSEEALVCREHQFFAKHLGLREAWRAYEAFRSSCAYLDIETDGASITTVGLYDGAEFKCFLKGENLENFRDEISRYSMIVTFCGNTFDVPALSRHFRGLQLDQIHVDLCPMLRKLGYRGGLKRIEKEFGIERPAELQGLTGFDAVILWRRYYGLGDDAALERLVAYNREDCVNLQVLAEAGYEQMKRATLG